MVYINVIAPQTDKQTMKQPSIPKIPTGYDGKDPAKLNSDWDAFHDALDRLKETPRSNQDSNAVPYVLPTPNITVIPARTWIGRIKHRHHLRRASRDISNVEEEMEAFKVYAADFRIKFGDQLRSLSHYSTEGNEYNKALKILLSEPYTAYGQAGYCIHCTDETMQELEGSLLSMRSRIAQYLKDNEVYDEAALKRLRYSRLENSAIDFVDAYTTVLSALPEMKAHPFISTMLPQVPVLKRKIYSRDKDIEKNRAPLWKATKEPRADWLASLQPKPEALDLSTLNTEVAALNANAKDFHDRFIYDLTDRAHGNRIIKDVSYRCDYDLHDEPGRGSIRELGKLTQLLMWRASNAAEHRGGFDELPEGMFERIYIQLEDMKPYFVKFFQQAHIHDTKSFMAARKKNDKARDNHNHYGYRYDARFDLLDIYMAFVKALSEIEQHPFITESAPQIPRINAKLERRREIARAEAEGKDRALQGPRVQFLQQLLQQEGGPPQLTNNNKKSASR